MTDLVGVKDGESQLVWALSSEVPRTVSFEQSASLCPLVVADSQGALQLWRDSPCLDFATFFKKICLFFIIF